MSQEYEHTAKELLKRLMFGESNVQWTRDLLVYLWERMEEEMRDSRSARIEWVSMKDREPEEGYMYLTCDEENNVNVLDWCREKADEDGKAEATCWRDMWNCGIEVDGIVYWAEFPDPPKKGE